VLVFTRTKHHATRLAERLQRSGFSATCLQGDMSQSKRQAAMDGFRNGKIDILVATDIAARGIDVPDISHVVNFDMPDTVDGYTHRVGRTARASRTGNAINIVTRDDVDVVNAVEARLNERLECRSVEGFDYEVPASAAARPTSRPSRPLGPSRPARRPERRRMSAAA